MQRLNLGPAQTDRACGAVLGSAIGDALGAPYEFGLARLTDAGPQMIGGGLGNFAPGEWTDDTTMAWAILDVAAAGADLRDEGSLTKIAQHFRDWYDSHPPDIGNQTRQVLSAAGPQPTGTTLTATSYDLHARTGHSAGNGSLMRTAPVALPYLGDAAACAEAARRVSALTHYDPDAQHACLLWSLAIRHAIVHGEFDVRDGLRFLDHQARQRWVELIDEAERKSPPSFTPNGWVVTAFQAAWSAIVHTPIPTEGPACEHFGAALATAIAIGDDTDTVAAIAGALLGARWGASAIPARWRRLSHGYPGLRGEELVGLAQLAATGKPGPYGWPTAGRIDYSTLGSIGTLVRHPHDPGVWLGDAGALDAFPEQITAVVSLCLLGRDQVPAGVEHLNYRLIDTPDPGSNPNVDFLLADAADTVAALRAEGREVLVHCVAAHSRTPTVGIAYALKRGVDLATAYDAVCAALPAARPNSAFVAALERMADSVKG